KRWQQRDAIARQAGAQYGPGELLEGKTVLVRAEQGIGDQIMFASCLPELMERAGGCVIEAWPKLANLFARSFPQAKVIAFPAGEREEADCRIPIGSLPLVVGRDWPNFPKHAGYLRADQARVAHWRSELARLGPGPKVGVSWRGGTPRTGLPLRSTGVAGLA